MMFSLTVYMPSDWYVWIGCFSTLVVPSPKSHRERITDPVLKFWNRTLSGAAPFLGNARNKGLGDRNRTSCDFRMPLRLVEGGASASPRLVSIWSMASF